MGNHALKFGSKKSKQNSKVITLIFLFCLFSSVSCATTGHQTTRAIVSGNLAAKKGNFIDAVRYYEDALKEMPNNAAAHRNLGIVLVKIGDYQRALDSLTKVYGTYSTDAELQYFLAETYRGLQKFSLAADHYQKGLRIEPTDMRLTKALGWTWHKMNQNDWAINLLAPYLRNDPNDHQLRLVLASALNAEKKYDKSIELLKFVETRKFELKSKDGVSAIAEQMLLYTALADAYAGKQDCLKAQKLFTQVLSMRPFFDAALTGSAKCNLKNNRKSLATKQLERAVKANPNSWEAHYYLAQLLSDQEKDKSVFYYNRFLELTNDKDKTLSKERNIAKSSLARLNSSP